MKKSILLALSISVITLLACNRGYYGHIPRAKTNKTETVKHTNTRQQEKVITQVEEIKAEYALTEENIVLDTTEVQNKKEVITQNPVVNKAVKKGKHLLNRYEEKKQEVKKSTSEPRPGDIPNELIVLLFVLAVAAAIVVLIPEAGASCGCVLVILALGYWAGTAIFG